MQRGGELCPGDAVAADVARHDDAADVARARVAASGSMSARTRAVAAFTSGNTALCTHPLKRPTRARGGPRVQTKTTVPDEWNGVYRQPRFSPNNDYWLRMQHIQVPTVLSLLTPEYQARVVQESYHQAHQQSQWPSQY